MATVATLSTFHLVDSHQTFYFYVYLQFHIFKVDFHFNIRDDTIG